MKIVTTDIFQVLILVCVEVSVGGCTNLSYLLSCFSLNPCLCGS